MTSSPGLRASCLMVKLKAERFAVRALLLKAGSDWADMWARPVKLWWINKGINDADAPAFSLLARMGGARGASFGDTQCVASCWSVARQPRDGASAQGVGAQHGSRRAANREGGAVLYADGAVSSLAHVVELLAPGGVCAAGDEPINAASDLRWSVAIVAHVGGNRCEARGWTRFAAARSAVPWKSQRCSGMGHMEAQRGSWWESN